MTQKIYMQKISVFLPTRCSILFGFYLYFKNQLNIFRLSENLLFLSAKTEKSLDTRTVLHSQDTASLNMHQIAANSVLCVFSSRPAYTRVAGCSSPCTGNTSSFQCCHLICWTTAGMRHTHTPQKHKVKSNQNLFI